MLHSVATKRKLSEMRRGERNPFFGKKHSVATRRKLARILRRYSKNRRYDISPPTVRLPRGRILAYIAGLIDGEGSIRFKAGRPFVAIYNSDPALKRWLFKHTGIDPRWSDERGRVRGWQWLLQSAANVYRFCSAVMPMLVVKKRDAATVIAYLEKKYGERLRHGSQDRN